MVTCGKDEENPAGPDPVEEDYIPYQVGNTWTYQVVPTTPGEPTYTATLTVVDKITENNVEMAVVKEQSSKNPTDLHMGVCVFYLKVLVETSLVLQLLQFLGLSIESFP